MVSPSGLSEIVKTFGDIKPYIRPDGTLRPDWEWHSLDTCDLPEKLKLGFADVEVSRIRCHRLLVPVFKAVFASIHAAGLWSSLKTYDGCFAYRPQRGGNKLSTHAWGIAIDLNADTNRLGTAGDMPTSVIQLFEANGFMWGGRFSRPDPMHFQFCRDY